MFWKKGKNKDSAKSADKKNPEKKKVSMLNIWFMQFYKPITAVACLCAFLLLYAFVINPKINWAQRIRFEQRAATEGEQNILQVKLGRLVALEAERRTIPADVLARAGEILPSDPDTPALLATFDAIAQESGVELSAMDVTIVEKNRTSGRVVRGVDQEELIDVPQGIHVVEISMSVDVFSYNDFKTFLINVEKSLRFIDVASVSFSPEKQEFEIDMRSYYFPQ